MKNTTETMEYSLNLLVYGKLLIPTYAVKATNYHKGNIKNTIECEKWSMNIRNSEETSKQFCAMSRTRSIVC